MFKKYDQEVYESWYIVLFTLDGYDKTVRTSPYNKEPTVEFAQQLAEQYGYEAFEIVRDIQVVKRYSK